MIEVVLNSETTANINKAAGGTKAVFQKDTLVKWVRENNPSESEFTAAQNRFLLSWAGYCVATYVLGIGDRHNDNIMVTRQGHLFRMSQSLLRGDVYCVLNVIWFVVRWLVRVRVCVFSRYRFRTLSG
mgnify:FL=1